MRIVVTRDCKCDKPDDDMYGVSFMCCGTEMSPISDG
jgi:hypothetical protein